MSAHHPCPNIPCVRCNKNHDTPAAFLMACAKCERAWHHTCHIPQVSEEEIMERISFDKQGKRDAGLAGWQCKRCTKRARLEPPPPVVASTSNQHQFKPSLNGHANAPARTTSNVPPQARDSVLIHIVISDDEDDIIILDDAPQQSQQSIADPKNEAQDIRAPAGTQQAVDQQLHTPSKSPLPQPPQPPQSAPVVGMDGPVKAQKTIKLSKTAQKRPAKSQLIITPLPTPREPPTSAQEPGPSAQLEPNHIPRPSPPPPPPPEPEDVPSRTRSLTPVPPPQFIQPEPTIQHITFPEPPAANMKTISTADIRALISTMRSDGRLAPPPEVEYVHTRPARHDAGPSDPTSKPAPRRSGARKLAYTPGRTPSPELDEVERKLEDFDDDGVEIQMDVDRRSDPDARQEEEEPEEGDPHNIDDLYGDVAPRYHSQPSRRSKSHSKTAPAPVAAPRPPPPAETRLLFAERAKRPPKADDLGLLLDKKLRIEGRRDERAPTKAAVTQRLKGKALQRKQEAGFYFSIHEERKRVAGG